MKHSIMTEKIARRGARVPQDYTADFLDQVMVRDVALRPVVSLFASQTVAEVRSWLGSDEPAADHQGFPITDPHGKLIGVLTRRDLLGPSLAPAASLATLLRRPATTIAPEASLREAADTMVRERVGRLPVVHHGHLVGIVTRSDVLGVNQRRIRQETHLARARKLPFEEQIRRSVSFE
jgi:CBS domain-containing protein